jgi:predicted DNA-binding protein
MKKVTTFLTDQELAALQALAERTGLKFADVLRRIIDKGLEESEWSHWARRPAGATDAEGSRSTRHARTTHS